MHFDVLIIGAGPAGLCLANSLAGKGLKIGILERLGEDAIANPTYDGREIALTKPSQIELEKLGLWQRFAAEDIAPLKDAKVFNGASLNALEISSKHAKAEQLGFLVNNCAIRKAAYDQARTQQDIQIFYSCNITLTTSDATKATLVLDDGRTFTTTLLVAADSRFSTTRRHMGIAARMQDFGKTMLVCKMKITHEHHNVAWEWFGYGQTVAILPLQEKVASIVLTLKPLEMEKIKALTEQEFNVEIEQRLNGRLGQMQLISERYYYPLVGVFADKLIGNRTALVGDAAVGMHPVTAHGFNFGLQSQKRLASVILTAMRRNQDFGSSQVLQNYDHKQRLASFPLYKATSLLIGLYTNDKKQLRMVRDAGLKIAQTLTPLRWALAHQLTGSTPQLPSLPKLPNLWHKLKKAA